MTSDTFNSRADGLAARAGVLETAHGYFRTHRTRLYETCRKFALFERELGDVLEVGPFYSYTPMLLRDRAKSYSVLEGEDGAAEALRPLYAEHRVKLATIDLFDAFGAVRGATQRLPYESDAFNTILCWETMEHFNFNPVPFVHELLRVTRPGGRVYLTVPNRASGEALFALLTDRNQRSSIDSYFKFADYKFNGKIGFLGFHWREYALTEFAHLFERSGFRIAEQGWLMHFQDYERLSLLRRIARVVLRGLCTLRPSLGKNCCLVVEKPAASGSPVQANNS